MLNFLKEARHQKTRKSIIKFQPEMVYGHTKESSPHMLNRHSLFYQPTEKLPQLKLSHNQNPPISELNGPKEQHISKQKLKERQTDATLSNFHLTKGEFTTFLDRHKHYNSIGELHKASNKQGTPSNMTLEKWNSSTNTLSKLNTNQSRQSKLSLKFQAKRSSIESSLPPGSIWRSTSTNFLGTSTDKAKIRNRRSQFAQQAFREIEQRKKAGCEGYGLPQKGPSHELYFVGRKTQGSPARITDSAQLNRDIDHFQKKLRIRDD